jgi:uncharacterized phage-associated protein
MTFAMGSPGRARTRIAFDFQPEKVIQALAFFSASGINDLTKLKAAKLLFYADKYHLLKYGRPVVGDRYVCMNYGPVPSEALNLMNDVLAPVEVDDAEREEFEAALQVDRGFLNRHRNPRFRARGPVNRSVFSESDIEALDYVAKAYGKHTASQLVDLTHEEEVFKCTDPARRPGGAVDIPYELFFTGAPAGAEEVLRLVQAEQEDREAAKALA